MSHFEVKNESMGVDAMSHQNADRKDCGNYAMSEVPLSLRDQLDQVTEGRFEPVLFDATI